MTSIKIIIIMMIVTIITKITTNNDQTATKIIDAIKNNFTNKRYIRKSLSSKFTSPTKMQMLKILLINTLDTLFNIDTKRCLSLNCASSVVFSFKRIRWLWFLSIEVNETSTKKPQWPEVQNG